MNIRYIFLAVILTSCVQADPDPAQPAPPVPVESRYLNQATKLSPFAAWKAEFRPKALAAGVSEKLVDEALSNLYVNKKIIALDRKQPEHKITKEQYLRNVINDYRVQRGKELLAQHKDVLADISQKSGVEPEFIVALWGLESGYGEITGNFSVVNSLATLAYEGRRREFFENELINALLIIDAGHTTLDGMIGSWAGAMGQCQFMPTSYIKYAVDYTGDGKADIWQAKSDVFASIANYLKTEGWAADKESKEKTLMHWNRSTYFVASVFQLAEMIK